MGACFTKGISRLVVCVACLSVIPGTKSYAADYLKAGMEAYGHKNYALARADLDKAVKVAPGDAVAHYYLANTLMQLHQYADACREYHAGLENAETDELRTHCRNALDRLEPKQEASRVPEASHTTAADTSLLQRQADEMKARQQSQTEAMQNHVRNTASAQAKQIREEVKAATDTTDWNWRARRKAAGYLNSIKEEGNAKADALESEARARARRYNQQVEETSKAYDESVRNLTDQMNSTKGVKVKAEGTSLYVRNYGK